MEAENVMLAAKALRWSQLGAKAARQRCAVRVYENRQVRESSQQTRAKRPLLRRSRR